jgi:methyl-accepting chemotaxis protein
MKKMSVGTKIIFMNSILVLFSVIIIVASSAITQMKQIRNNLTSTVMEKSSNLSNEIDSFITQNVAVLEGIANLDDIQSFNTQEQEKVLQSINNKYTDYALIFILDPTGQQVARSLSGEYTNNSDRDYFTKILKSNNTIISDVLISKSTGKPAVVVITPIVKQGATIGYLAGTLDLSVVEKLRSEVVLGDTGYAFLTDTNSKVLGHPNKELQEQMADFSGMTIVQKALSGEEGVTDYTYEGKRIFGSYTMAKTTGWPIIVSQEYSEAMAPIYLMLLKFIAFTFVILLVTISAGWIFSRRIIKPIKILNDASNHLAQGDLSYEFNVASNDEIGDLAKAFTVMRENLKDLIQRMTLVSDNLNTSSEEMLSFTKEVSSVSNQIAEGITSLAQGSTDQAKSIQTTSSSINNIVTSINDINSRSNTSYETSNKTLEIVRNGVDIMKTQDIKMKDGVQAVGHVSDVIDSLNDKAIKIEEIISVIQGISEQTNLLALNAAIEAARAGEQGKGFAVVAEEVRKLAEGSKKSTEEIQSIMNDIRNTTQIAVTSASHATDVINEQNEAVRNTSIIFKDIIQMVESIAVQVQEVSKETVEVKNEGNSILLDVESISAVSEETAASTEEITASVEEQTASIHLLVEELEKLNSLANELKESTDQFKL